MGTTIGGKDVATTGSGHVAVSTPAVSLNPPPPPAGPVPAPYVYTARSATATKTQSKLMVGGKPVLVEGSEMDVDPPANQPSQPTGGDVVTHAVKGKAVMTQGSSLVRVGGKRVCTTGDMVRMNVLTGAQTVAQVTAPLLRAGGTDAAGATSGAGAATKKAGKTSGPAAPARREVGHPVDVASGHVVDRAVDIELPGSLPLVWKRSYSSGRSKDRGALGRGGWTHSLAQTVREEAEVITLRAEDGRAIYFAKVQPGASTFHRAERLTLTAEADGRYAVTDHASRTTRVFAPLVAHGPAVLRAIRDPFGQTITLDYHGGRLVEVVDAVGRKVVVKNDARGRVVRLEVWAAPPKPAEGVRVGERQLRELTLKLWCDYAYHPEGELASVTDALGYTERFDYDGFHRMVKTTLKNGVSFHYAYDEDTGRCVKTWGDGDVHRCELDYNVNQGTTTVTATNEARKYTWNVDGLIVREETFVGDFVRARVYDDDHYLISEANAAGEKTSYTYDECGNRTQVIDPAGNTTRWEYTADLPVKRVGPDGLVTTYTHDDRGLLAEILDPEGLSYRIAHDAAGCLQAVYGLDGLLVGFGYDSHGNLAEETDARGARTAYAFDALGRPLLRIDPLGRRTGVEVDLLGRPVCVRRPDDTSTRTEYDTLGNPSQLTDAFGQVTTLEYAGTGVLVRLVRADGQVWRLSYDSDERLVRIKNPRCEEYVFEYDRAGRVERETTFDRRILEYRWSKAERLARIDYPDRTWREFFHDPLGNVIEEHSPDAGIVLERDPLGRLRRAELSEYSDKVVVTFERDSLGRVIAETQGERTIRYEHDLRGRRAARVLPGGAITSYRYDRTGALASVDHDGHQITIERDDLGREIHRRVSPGRLDIQSAYDSMDRLTEQKVTSLAPAVLSRRRWGYDEAGRVRQIAADRRGGTTHYQYDAIGQLIEASRGKHHDAFEYDPTGSLINVLDDLDQVGHVMPWSALPGNLLTKTPQARYTNDARGRRIEAVEVRAEEDGSAPEEAVTTYAWDVRDRLREVRLPSGERVLFTYDAFGRRVRKEVIPAERGDFVEMVQLALAKGPQALPKSRVIEFLWDGDALAAEIESERTRVFVHELGTLIPMLQQEQGAVFTYITDHLGTPKELVDPEGRIAWAAHHSAWGRVVETWRDPKAKRKVDSPFRLLGQYADLETALCCTRFRYFDPDVARWLSPDPLGIHGGLNLLAFDGDPTNTSDPLGLCAHGATDAPRAYSVAMEAELARAEFGLGRRRHFDIANHALRAARAANLALAELVPAPAGWGRPPPGWAWQHATREQASGRAGVLQLVPKSQHTPGSPFWRLLHPLPGGGGGYTEWAIPAGAPSN